MSCNIIEARELVTSDIPIRAVTCLSDPEDSLGEWIKKKCDFCPISF